jgi:hypothetical protein
MIGVVSMSIFSGRMISNTGRYRIYPIIGTALLSGAFFLLTFATYDKPVIFTMAGMLMAGLGLGQLMQTLTLASQNAVGARDIGVATSSATFFRQIGGTLGVAVIFSVLFSVLPGALGDSFKNKDLVSEALDAALNPAVASAENNQAIMQTIYDPIVVQITAQLPPGVDLSDDATRGQIVDKVVENLDGLGSGAGGSGDLNGSLDGDTSFLNEADDALKAPFLNGFANASIAVCWVGAFVVLLAFILSFFLKATPLREKSAVQEAADERAAQAELEAEAALAANEAGSFVGPQTGSIPTPEPARR